jgi:hypothetical protein
MQSSHVSCRNEDSRCRHQRHPPKDPVLDSMSRLCGPGPCSSVFETPKLPRYLAFQVLEFNPRRARQSGERGAVTPMPSHRSRPVRRAFHGGPEAVGWSRRGGMFHVRPKPGAVCGGSEHTTQQQHQRERWRKQTDVRARPLPSSIVGLRKSQDRKHGGGMARSVKIKKENSHLLRGARG